MGTYRSLYPGDEEAAAKPPDLAKDALEPVVVAAAAKVPAAVGLRSFDEAPSRMAKCWACSQQIAKGSWRFDYRMKASSSLRDQRRAHAECVGQVPPHTRWQDVAAVEGWLQDANLNEEAVDMLTRALVMLRATAPGQPSGPSSSSGAAVVAR